MDTLWNNLDDNGAGSHELVQELDSWAIDVLQSRGDALGISEDEFWENRCLDHFVTVVVTRDRLKTVAGSSDFYLVAAIDALFRSFTEDVGSEWILVTGQEDIARDEWWWNRLPVSGPARDEFDELVSKGVLERRLHRS